MEGTVTVQMTVEEYNRINQIENLLSQMVKKSEELKEEIDILNREKESGLLIKVIIDLEQDKSEKKVIVMTDYFGNEMKTENLDFDKISWNIRSKINSIEYIANEFQKTKRELNRIPKWIRRIFK